MQRVARTHLVPEKMVVLVVGDQKQIDLGDPKHPVALATLAPGGKVETLPLRDPMTMKPRRPFVGSRTLFWNAATKSFSAKGLLLLTFPVRKSFAPSSWRPFHTSRKSVAGPLK